MPIAVKPGRAMAVASLGSRAARGAADACARAAGPPSAATLTCNGQIEKVRDTEDFENAMDYEFACVGRILGYMRSDRELDAFDNTIGVIAPTDGFPYEGDIPGIGCCGSYCVNNVERGTISVGERPASPSHESNARLVVAEAIDIVPGVPKRRPSDRRHDRLTSVARAAAPAHGPSLTCSRRTASSRRS